MVFSACRRHDAAGRPRQSVRRPRRQTLLQFRRHHPGVGRRMGHNPERMASRARGDQCVGTTPAAEFGTLPGIHAAQRPTHPQTNETERQPPEPKTARPHGTLHQRHHQPWRCCVGALRWPVLGIGRRGAARQNRVFGRTQPGFLPAGL